MKNNMQVLWVLLTAQLIGQANATIANIAAPLIKVQLHANNAQIELMVGMYLVTFAVLIITGARLGHMFGFKRLFVGGMALFGISSLLCVVAPTITMLIVGRALQGVGVALMFPQTLTGIHLIFTGKQRLRAMGLYSMALASGAVLGQILGGLIIAAGFGSLGWRAIFLPYIPIVGAIIYGAVKFLPDETTTSTERLDIPGVLLLTVTILLLILPLTIGQELHWPLWALVSIIASVPLFCYFLYLQKRKEQRAPGSSLVSVKALSHPTILWGLASMLIATSTYYAFIYIFTVYYQGQGGSALHTALLLTTWAVGFASSGQIVKRVPERYARLLPYISYGVFALSFVLISLLDLHSPVGIGLLVVLFIASGVGQGSGFIGLFHAMTGKVDKQHASDLSGAATTVLEISGALGVAAFGGLYTILYAHTAALSAFSYTNLYLAAATGLAAVLAYIAMRVRIKGAQNV